MAPSNSGDGGDEGRVSWYEPAQGYQDPDVFSTEEYTTRPPSELHENPPTWSAGELDIHNHEYTTRPPSELHENPTWSAGELDIHNHEYTTRPLLELHENPLTWSAGELNIYNHEHTTRPLSEMHANPTWSAGELDIHNHEYTTRPLLELHENPLTWSAGELNIYNHEHTTRPLSEMHANPPTWSAGEFDIHNHEYTNFPLYDFAPRSTFAEDEIFALFGLQPAGNILQMRDASAASMGPFGVWPPLIPNNDSYYDPDSLADDLNFNIPSSDVADPILQTQDAWSNPNEHVPDYAEDATNVKQSPASTTPNTASKKKTPRHSFIEWEERELDIWYYYVEMGYPLPKVVEEMQANGFDATQPMYKRMFKKLGWITYVRGLGVVQNIRNRPLQQTADPQFESQTPSLSPSTIQSSSSNSGGFSPGTVTAHSPMIHHIASMGIGASERLFTVMLFDVQSLYGSHIRADKFKVKDELKVQEDDHDDLFVIVGVSLRNVGSDNASAHKMIRKAFQVLKKVVGAKEGYDCGFFSLPAIWTSYLRFIREAQNTEPQNLEEIIFRVYRSCIDYVGKLLGNYNITFLSLWADFVVYLEKSLTNDTEVAVRYFLKEFDKAVQRSGKENGEYDDYTLKLLGMILYVQQSTPTMAKEAENTAKDMVRRIQKRVAETGERLQGELLTIWKDLWQALGTICHDRGDDETAVVYLDKYLAYGVTEERDLFALQQQEQWYELLGAFDDALKVRQWWLRELEILSKGVVVESLPIEDFENADQRGGA
ncbi:hypothetical protein BKA65DRAFT_536247 [Rhexocercosporidium sp. MPI-PUGE-AT-0058]|nr:hypothetical protein BKA65DRAFT_536247 [Rhexocercosporidium sp. MPI-PUGE-AT-0058]